MSRKKRPQQDVTLNLAAMLDMAFQLLTFFILTFQPPPVEGQISLRLPPAQVVANATGKNDAGSTDKPAIDIKGVDTLTLTIFANDSGDFGTMGVGAEPSERPAGLGDCSLQKPSKTKTAHSSR